MIILKCETIKSCLYVQTVYPENFRSFCCKIAGTYKTRVLSQVDKKRLIEKIAVKDPEWVLHAIKTVYYCEITHVCPLLVTLSNDMLFTHIIIKYWLHILYHTVYPTLERLSFGNDLSVLKFSKVTIHTKGYVTYDALS